MEFSLLAINKLILGGDAVFLSILSFLLPSKPLSAESFARTPRSDSVVFRRYAFLRSLQIPHNVKKGGQSQTNNYSCFYKKFATKQPMKRLFATLA